MNYVCMYNVISKETTKKSIYEMLKDTTDKPKWILRNVQVSRRSLGKEIEKLKIEETKIKQTKITDLSPV